MGNCFCIDLRKLNQLTIKDAYSIPHIEDTLDCLKGEVWFTSLDSKSEYWQVKISEESKALSQMQMYAIWIDECTYHVSTPNGDCLRELQLTWCIIFLHDIMVFTETL